jgi:hypothetical protein
MAHEWIFDVLNDLRSYAEKNDLPGLALQVAATLRVAQSEIGGLGAITGNQIDRSPDQDEDAG